MARSPFYPFRNTTLVFLIDDVTDTVDASGNPVPVQREVVLQCFLEPKKSAREYNIPNGQGIGVSESILEGFVVSGKMTGIKPKDKSISAVYMGQKGEFINLIDLPDPVGASRITGDSIVGLFRLIGGV